MGTRLGVLALALLSCGKGPGPTGPQPDLDNMKMYEPFGMKAEAKLPDKAVVLGTDEKGGSTVLKIPTAGATLTVDALGVRDGAAAQVGIKLQTAPNADGTVHVGIFEDRAGDGGEQWRAGVWVAAIVAAHTLGKDLTDFTFTASVSGVVDGPSASALVAGGFLATMTGATIDPSATMTGVINPDGTVGPAEKLVEKFDVALAKGKKRIGFPSGMRRVKSGTGTIDLVEHAQKKGATAVEIATVHDVYKLLTNKALPATLPVSAGALALDATATAAVGEKYKLWQTKYAALGPGVAEVEKANVPPALVGLAKAAKQYGAQAQALYSKGAAGAAFARMVAAWAIAATATDTYAALVKVRANELGEAGAFPSFDKLDPSSALAKIAEIRPTTIGGHLLMMGAFQSALRGSGFVSLARWRVELAREHLRTLAGKSKTELASPKVAEEVVNMIAPAHLLIARSTLDTTIAVQRLEFESAKSIGYMCSIPNVIKLATSYRSASTAGMSYLDSLIVEPQAKAQSISIDDARLRVVSTEPDYLVAYALAHLDEVAVNIKEVLGETSLAWNLMLLAGAERAYIDAAGLTTKYYSFSDAIFHEEALAASLVNAERAARAAARAADIATGAVPIQAKFSFELANALREGDRGDKLDALASYWSATAYSQAAVMLARN